MSEPVLVKDDERETVTRMGDLYQHLDKKTGLIGFYYKKSVYLEPDGVKNTMYQVDEKNDMERIKANIECYDAMRGMIKLLRDRKPEDRSEAARRYAVTITEAEKLMAYFWLYVVQGYEE